MALPVKVACEIVPAGVSVCACVGSTVPVKTSAGTVPCVPTRTGTPAGQATVPAGVIEATPPAGFEVVAVIPVVVELLVAVVELA